MFVGFFNKTMQFVYCSILYLEGYAGTRVPTGSFTHDHVSLTDLLSGYVAYYRKTSYTCNSTANRGFTDNASFMRLKTTAKCMKRPTRLIYFTQTQTHIQTVM